jgi:DNA repair protein RecN (Recombination protein N)
MLAELRVQGLAVIRDARCELGTGLNVLTGETGAGKSMLVDALALLLGERAAADRVRPDAPRAVVEGAFDLDGRPAARAALERLGIETDDGTVVLKREVAAAGKSRAWINGSPVTAGILGEVGRLLVDLHGQHETQSLLRSESQRDILDAFGDAAAEAAAVAEAHRAREALRREKAELEARLASARRRSDYLAHLVEEITRAAPKSNELDFLDAEARRLSHAEELGRAAGELAALLDGDDRSAAASLGHGARLLAALERIDPGGVAGWRDLLDGASIQVEELARTVREYAAGVETDPARLTAVERRRDVLLGLDRKYGPGLDRVLETLEEARRELGALDTADQDLGELSKRLEDSEAAFAERCRALSRKRERAARRLSKAVTAHLPSLGMPEGRFRVALEPASSPGANGVEAVSYLVELNPGMGERPLARVASGGELSRLMLALKVELARHDAVPTLVFDEVDQGVGGHVAGRLADSLRSVAESHQVLVITHLPQVAAAAARHLLVTKDARAGTTEAGLRQLTGEERVEEVARMLGGATGAAVRHARQLLKLTRA